MTGNLGRREETPRLGETVRLALLYEFGATHRGCPDDQ